MEYQVEYTPESAERHVTEPYGQRLEAAKQRARRMSAKHTVAYVVAVEEEPVGHILYAVGAQAEVEGRVL